MSEDRSCPLGHVCHKCLWHIQIMGKDPTTGQDINRRDCAITWIPILTIENSMRQHQTNAAVDKLHGEVTRGNDGFRELIRLAAGNGKDRQARLE